MQTNAVHDEIVGIYGDRLKLRITAPPIDGKANAHIIKWLGTVFNVPRSEVAILQGELGRQKTLRINCPKQLPEKACITLNKSD